jgi:FMN phosphatase YigB (HAD superfamily)
MKLRVKGVTFSMENTLMYLVTTGRPYIEMSDYLVNRGYKIYPKELEAAWNFVFYVDLTNGFINTWYDWTRQLFKRLGINEVDQPTMNGLIIMQRASSEGFNLYDDVESVLKKLHEQGFVLSIVTTMPLFRFGGVARRIMDYFTIIVTGANAGCAKGNPKMYQFDLASKMLKPEENLFVGDDSYYDIEIPHKMGQHTMHLTREGGNASDLADFVIKGLNEILDHIELK